MSTKVEDSLQKTLVLGYFLEKFDGLSCFNVKELQKGFLLAKEKTPTNINDMINKNISKGFMMEAQEKKDKKKTWCLTNLGEKYVETKLL